MLLRHSCCLLSTWRRLNSQDSVGSKVLLHKDSNKMTSWVVIYAAGESTAREHVVEGSDCFCLSVTHRGDGIHEPIEVVN